MSKFLDFLSNFLDRRKGLLPLIGLGLIFLNLILQFILPGNILATSNLFLHIGVMIALLGLLIAWAL